MNVLTRPLTRARRDDEPIERREGPAFVIWKKMLERRLNDGKAMENHRIQIRPRSVADIAHFELMWKPTGRDAYRFAIW